MKKIKVNLKEVEEVKDLEGMVYPLERIENKIGNVFFVNAETLEMHDISRAIHKTGEAEVTEEDLNQIIFILNNCAKPFRLFAMIPIIKYFEQKLLTLKSEKDVIEKKD